LRHSKIKSNNGGSFLKSDHIMLACGGRNVILKNKKGKSNHNTLLLPFFMPKINKMSVKIRLLSFFFILKIIEATAQNNPLDEPIFQEILENIAKRNALNPDFDAHQFVEHLENLLENPLDINVLDRADLENLWLLSDAQINGFFNYKATMGAFLALEEVQAIPSWSLEDVRRLQPFLEIKIARDADGISHKSLIIKGKNEIRLRNTNHFDNQNPADVSKFAGSNTGVLLRFRHTNGQRLSYGFSADKDAGETFFRKDNRSGFDFYSAHFFARNWSRRVKTLAFGDFKVNFGQGLLIAGGFSMGKTSNSILVKKNDVALRPHAAGGEDFFQRGAATTLLFGNWETTIFTSFLKKDASVFSKNDTLNPLDDEAFSSFSIGGLHRLSAEILNEKTVEEWLSGASVHFQKERFRMGGNSIFTHFNRPISNQNRAENPAIIDRNVLTINSLDYAGTIRNIHFFGETARSQNGGFSTLNGAIISLDRRVSLAVVHRDYGVRFQNIYGAAFGEIREPSNERGLYAGLEIRPKKTWQLNGYLDFYEHKWPRADSKGASGGIEIMGSAAYIIRKKGRVQLQIRTEKRHFWTEINENNAQKTRIRLQTDWKLSKSISWLARAEQTFFSSDSDSIVRGFLIYQELRIKPKNKSFFVNLRYLLFDSDGANARIYTFETHFSDSHLVPSFSGKGARLAVRGGYYFNSKLVFEVFLGRTNYLKPIGRQVLDVRGQMRWIL
jgi:hypothetical protein